MCVYILFLSTFPSLSLRDKSSLCHIFSISKKKNQNPTTKLQNEDNLRHRYLSWEQSIQQLREFFKNQHCFNLTNNERNTMAANGIFAHENSCLSCIYIYVCAMDFHIPYTVWFKTATVCNSRISTINFMKLKVFMQHCIPRTWYPKWFWIIWIANVHSFSLFFLSVQPFSAHSVFKKKKISLFEPE